jgi:RNA polymerase sigma-70 factor (sigma-E family)
VVAITGDSSALEAADIRALHQLHWAGLWRLATLLTSDPAAAEDLVQEAFARLLRATGGRRGPAAGAELAYLRRTVVNLSNSRFRRLGVARRHAPTLAALDDHPSAESEAGATDDGRRVRAAVEALPARQRACTVLHYFEGLSDAEIAAVLGISTGSVKTHLHRARAALAAALDEREEER